MDGARLDQVFKYWGEVLMNRVQMLPSVEGICGEREGSFKCYQVPG